MAWPQKLEADTRCHAKLPTDQELLYHGCGSTVRVSIEEAGLAVARAAGRARISGIISHKITRTLRERPYPGILTHVCDITTLTKCLNDNLAFVFAWPHHERPRARGRARGGIGGLGARVTFDSVAFSSSTSSASMSWPPIATTLRRGARPRRRCSTITLVSSRSTATTRTM